MFKNLFAPKPELPLTDGHPPRRLRTAAPVDAPVDAPMKPRLPSTFEIVGTLIPFDKIEEEDRMALQSDAPAPAAAADLDDESMVPGLSEADMRLLRQTLDGDRARTLAQGGQFADSLVFSLRIRRIRDDATRDAFEGTLRAYTERKMKAFAASHGLTNFDQVWTSVEYASHDYKYSCLPTEKVLLWASTDDRSSQLFKDLILAYRWRRISSMYAGNGTDMENFFTSALFGPYESDVSLTASGYELPLPGEDPVQYRHTKSYKTKWDKRFRFSLPGLPVDATAPMRTIFAASEFYDVNGVEEIE